MPKEDPKQTEMVFTDRQVEILDGWSRTASISALAQELGITENTVQTHLKRLRSRLNVKRTVDVYLYMMRNNHLNNL